METHEHVWQDTTAALNAVALICFALHLLFNSAVERPLEIDADTEQRVDGCPIQLFVTAPRNSTNDHVKQKVDAHLHLHAERRDTRSCDLPWSIALLSDALRQDDRFMQLSGRATAFT